MFCSASKPFFSSQSYKASKSINYDSRVELTIKLVKFTAINDRRGFIRLATYFLKEKLIQMLETEPLVAPISNCLSSSCIE